jgi:hypothetical protein
MYVGLSEAVLPPAAGLQVWGMGGRTMPGWLEKKRRMSASHNTAS